MWFNGTFSRLTEESDIYIMEYSNKPKRNTVLLKTVNICWYRVNITSLWWLYWFFRLGHSHSESFTWNKWLHGHFLPAFCSNKLKPAQSRASPATAVSGVVKASGYLLLMATITCWYTFIRVTIIFFTVNY